MTTDDGQVLRVPAREIPVPSALSPEAKAVLAVGSARRRRRRGGVARSD